MTMPDIPRIMTRVRSCEYALRCPCEGVGPIIDVMSSLSVWKSSAEWRLSGRELNYDPYPLSSILDDLSDVGGMISRKFGAKKSQKNLTKGCRTVSELVSWCK